MDAFDIVDTGYRRLYDRIRAVLGSDERVASISAAGSVATGSADRWSDLDVHVVAAPGRRDDLLADWPRWLSLITPTVFARTPIAPWIINTVTDDGLTLDIAVLDQPLAPVPAAATGYTVGMLAHLRFATLGEALDYAVAEQLRGLAGPFISLVQRDEHMRHLSGVPHLLGLLTTVFLAETGNPPPGKQWNQTFTAEQQAAVAALPPVAATREAIIGFGLALAEMLLTRARPLFPSYGLDWPTDLAAVARGRLHEQLQIDCDWLH